MPQRSAGYELVRQYLEKFPDAASRTIAETLWKKHCEVWPTFNACRLAVRRARGNQGEYQRNNVSDKSKFRPNQPGDGNPFGTIPQGMTEFEEWAPVCYDGPLKALVLCDIHVPYHHRESLTLALQRGLDEKCDFVLLNGDILDCYSVSRWEKDPRKRNFKRELKRCRLLLASIREAFPDAKIVYKIGNHEERWESYMKTKAPEILGIKQFRLERLLRFEKFGVECVTDKRPIRLGQLNVLHGHEYRFAISNPVNPARGLFLRGHRHAICGHFHQSSHHGEKDLEQKVTSCWSTGCLCDMHPDYMPLNKWNHGFMVVTIDDTGAFRVNNFRIIEGKVWE